jgi:hypothetical protein
MGGRVQNEDMTSLNRHLHTRDEEDTPFPSVGEKVVIEGHLVMIGDRNHVKIFIGSFRDKLFGCVSDAVEGIFSRVKMEVSLKGSLSFNFENRFFHYHLIPGKILQENRLFIRLCKPYVNSQRFDGEEWAYEMTSDTQG